VSKILVVIPNLEYSGAARQLCLLATGLAGTTCEIRVCTLGAAGPVAETLRTAGITVDELGWRRWIELKPFWRFRQLMKRFAPDIVHVWRMSSLRVVRILGAGRSRMLASAAWPMRKRPGLPGALDRKAFQRAEYVVATSSAEVERCMRLGLPAEKVVLIPPGVRSAAMQKGAEKTLRQVLHLNDAIRLILCVGPLEHDKGYLEAIWAFDILSYLYDNLHLVVVGGGPYRERMERFVHDIQCAGRVHFIGPQPEAARLLSEADIVWVPSRASGGVNVALEAMAAGRPVVASAPAGLTEIIRDGETGFLVPLGDKAALARQTRLLIEDQERAQRMGASGRQHVLSQFSVASLIEQYAKLYERLAAVSPVQSTKTNRTGGI